MTIHELFNRYLPHRRFKSVAEAGEAIFAIIEFGYLEGLINDEVYLENKAVTFSSGPWSGQTCLFPFAPQPF